jgi:glycosyltransferase involved in cell wall biosynthesis
MTMPKLLQINITANWGSHGRIAEEIGQLAIAQGWESYIAYGRYANPSKSHLIKIGSMTDEYIHGMQSRLLDNHGLASKGATKELLKEIDRLSPDIIHLHNIHGYYLNYPILFHYLATSGVPVVWTLHDCWPITGHCAYFTYAQCNQWKRGCKECLFKYSYPKSWFGQRSAKNYVLKKECFTKCQNLTIVPVSQWLRNIIKESFLASYPTNVIYNGVDIETFSPTHKMSISGKSGKYIVLGVNSVWEKRKGLEDFKKLRKLLDERFDIVLIGLDKNQIKNLPKGVIGIERTNDVYELVNFYRSATVFVNPTYEDNFPTTSIEAMACGTPVLTYRTGGSPEAIDEGKTGLVLPYGDVNALASSIMKGVESGSFELMRLSCRRRAEMMYNKNDRFQEYIKLYQSLLVDSSYHGDVII